MPPLSPAPPAGLAEARNAPSGLERQSFNRITISDDHSEGSAIKRRKLMAVASAEIDLGDHSIPYEGGFDFPQTTRRERYSSYYNVRPPKCNWYSILWALKLGISYPDRMTQICLTQKRTLGGSLYLNLVSFSSYLPFILACSCSRR